VYAPPNVVPASSICVLLTTVLMVVVVLQPVAPAIAATVTVSPATRPLPVIAEIVKRQTPPVPATAPETTAGTQKHEAAKALPGSIAAKHSAITRINFNMFALTARRI
jgi:hypothetical protein